MSKLADVLISKLNLHKKLVSLNIEKIHFGKESNLQI